jgi:hypothetical protein
MPALLLSAISYAGLALVLAGTVSLLKPLAFLHIPTRGFALGVAAVGLPLALVGAWWPWPVRAAMGEGRIDAFVPAFQFVELHETRVRATPDAVYRAIRAVRADDIRAFRTLTWIRSPRLPWREGHESIMNAGQDPILDVATRSGFFWLADDRNREALVGTVVCCRSPRPSNAEQFLALTGPGFAKAAMNFRIEDLGGGECRLTTETRVFATDVRTRRRFGLYWAFIYPGSSLIRYGWLAAIRKHAEGEVARAAS